MSIKLHSFLLKQYPIEKQNTLIHCNITGIALTISIPTLPVSLEYNNPLAHITNCLTISQLSSKELIKLSPELLAGIVLSYLTHYHLIQDKYTAIERNLLIRNSTPIYWIVESIKFFSTITFKKALNLPTFSLESLNNPIPTTEKNNNNKEQENILRNYIIACKRSLYGDVDDVINNGRSSKSIQIYGLQSKAKIVKHSSMTPELRQECKDLLTLLINENNINPKIISLLKIVSIKDNLVTLHITIREKLVNALKKHGTINAVNMANFLKNVESNLTMQERIFKSQDETSLDRASDSFNKPTTKLSLAEIIAMRKNNTIIPVDNEHTEQELNEDLEETVELLMPTEQLVELDGELSFTSSIDEQVGEQVEETKEIEGEDDEF